MIDYFIVCHNKDYIKKILNNIFFKDFQFLYVGNKKIEKLDRVIICNKLSNNLEKFPYLCSYTAWYAIAKNKINKNDYVCLLEYDNLFSKDFFNKNLKSIKKKNVISYSQTIIDHYVFYKSTPWLEISLKKIYNIDLMDFVNQYKEEFPFWSTTTNKTLHMDVLKEFVDWYEPLNITFRKYPMGAYVHERAFFIFCVLKNIKINYLKDILFHKQSSSHNIQDVYGKVLNFYKTPSITEEIKKQYDIIYNEELYNSKLLLGEKW